MNRGERKVLSDRNQRTDLPRRNLFRKTRSSDQNLAHHSARDKVRPDRSRSRSRARNDSDWRNRGHENDRPVRYRPQRVRRSSVGDSSPNAKSSSSPVKKAPVSKSWAEMDEQDEDQMWQLLTPESLDQSDKTATGKTAVNPERDILPVTPRTGKKITVEELLGTPTVSEDVCFKAPLSGSRVTRSGSRRSSRNQQSQQQKSASRCPTQMETDMDTLKRRQKDLDYGKNTIGYQNYVDQVPKGQRTKYQPTTPDKFRKMPRRTWDNAIRMWRKHLHQYDPTDGEDQETELSDILSDMSFDSKITFGDFSPASSAFPPSSPVSFLTFDEYPPLSSEGNLTDPDYDPAQDKESDMLADMDEADFLS